MSSVHHPQNRSWMHQLCGCITSSLTVKIEMALNHTAWLHSIGLLQQLVIWSITVKLLAGVKCFPGLERACFN